MDKRRDPYDLGGTLGDLVAQNDAVSSGKQRPAGRLRPRFPSEEQRERLTVDVDLEPAVAEVLRRLAASPPERYGLGEIRPGDLAVACLIAGLIDFGTGHLGLLAEWTIRSRGKRNVILGDVLDAMWDDLLGDLVIDRYPDSAANPPPVRQRTVGRPPADF